MRQKVSYQVCVLKYDEELQVELVIGGFWEYKTYKYEYTEKEIHRKAFNKAKKIEKQLHYITFNKIHVEAKPGNKIIEIDYAKQD